MSNQTLEASVLIVGAGLSGLTALVSARKYIPHGETIIIADQKSGYGGQWLDAYDFVRLHQPYPMYTAYDVEWPQNKDKDHLASRDEILTHFHNIAEQSRATPLFSHRYVKHFDVGDEIMATFRHVKTGEIVFVRSKRMIMALPLGHVPCTRFNISSKIVSSISIKHLSQHLESSNSAHYVIVGSGKSGMDAIKYIHDHQNVDTEQNPVTLIAGRGVAFLNRNQLFPKGTMGKLFGGCSFLGFLTQLALDWDGENEEELMKRYLDRNMLLSAEKDPTSCQFGIMGEDELEKIKKAVGMTIKGRMIDIVDVEGKPILIMEDGTQIELRCKEKEIVLVNCTEILGETPSPKPILSDNGKTLNIQMIIFIPSMSTVALTHAWFLNKLEGEDGLMSKIIPVRMSLDVQKRRNYLFRGALITLNNYGHVLSSLPLNTVKNDKSNGVLWFPIQRQMYALFMLIVNMPDIKRQCQRIVGEDYFPREDLASLTVSIV